MQINPRIQDNDLWTVILKNLFSKNGTLIVDQSTRMDDFEHQHPLHRIGGIQFWPSSTPSLCVMQTLLVSSECELCCSQLEDTPWFWVSDTSSSNADSLNVAFQPFSESNLGIWCVFLYLRNRLHQIHRCKLCRRGWNNQSTHGGCKSQNDTNYTWRDLSNLDHGSREST